GGAGVRRAGDRHAHRRHPRICGRRGAADRSGRSRCLARRARARAARCAAPPRIARARAGACEALSLGAQRGTDDGAVSGMRIGIDARKIADFGIGTYIRGLLRGLEEIGAPEEYVVFGPSSPSPRFEHVPFDAPHYSARELIDLGRAIRRARLDLFHAPHYVVPFTATPVVVTIHDLIHLHARHRNPLKPLYARAMLGRAVRKSRRVLTVSEAVKRDIVETFHCADEHVVVAPNGIDPHFCADRSAGATSDYFLFV